MGGSAFGPDFPSVRITTPNYHRLVTLLSSRLSTHFNRIEHLRFFDDKMTHGDVDILCAWTAPPWAFVPLHKTSTVSPAVREQAEKGRKAFVDGIAGVAGAVRWGTSGAQMGSLEIHLGIPCSTLEGESGKYLDKEQTEEKEDVEPFYQVDLLLCPPHNFDFRLFNGSYSTTNIILGQAVRGIAYELTLREEDLILRHSPIDEVPRIDLLLTDNIEEFCLWLGLDYDRWQQGFANRDQFMVTVPPGSNMGYSLRGLARKWSGGYIPPVGSRARVEEMVDYYAFLQRTNWASLPTNTPAQPRAARNGDSPKDRSPYPLGVEVREINDIDVLIKEIEKPSRWPLKPQAMRALDYWGVRTEYFDLVAERREMKKVILRSRLRKVKRARWRVKVKVVLRRIVGMPKRGVEAVKGFFKRNRDSQSSA